MSLADTDIADIARVLNGSACRHCGEPHPKQRLKRCPRCLARAGAYAVCPICDEDWFQHTCGHRNAYVRSLNPEEFKVLAQKIRAHKPVPALEPQERRGAYAALRRNVLARKVTP